MFKSVIAHVGILIGCLLCFSIGGFFLYVGETGSWDPVTTFFAFQGMLIGTGLLCILVYPWCKRAKQEAKDNNLICTDPGGIEAEIKSLEDALELAGSEDEMEAIGARLDRLEKLRDNPTDPFATRRK